MKRLFYIISSFFIFLITSLLFNVHSQESWTINSFVSEIIIQQDGRVKVTETISVDFDALKKHGIYRDIPYVYQDENGKKTHTEINVTNVKKNSANEKYAVSNNKSYLRIKIGDPDKTISGLQNYQIEYLATGVLKSYEAYDELYWNVTGNYWEVPIGQVFATVRLPKEGIEKTICFEGQQGSTQPCPQEPTGNKNEAVFRSSQNLSLGEGMTIAVAYAKGMVPILTAKPPPTFESMITQPVTLVSFLTTLLLGFGFIFRKWWIKGRDFWFKATHLYDKNAKEETMPIGAHETIVVEYEPPEKLQPALLGTLVDEKADTRDVTATIIDFAQRGFLTIAEIPKKWAFGKTDYKLTKKAKDTKVLLAYEKELFDSLFENREEVNVSSLKKTFFDDLADVKKKLYEEVVSKKLFPSNPETIRNLYLGLSIGLIIVGGVIFGISAGNLVGPGIGVGAALVLSGIFTLIFHRAMGKRTAYGRELYRRTRGYYLFIDKAEKHRQKFFENKNLFNEVLPYAIVFGLVDKFANSLKDMGIKPNNPTWYSGTHTFSPIVFAQDLNGFSNSFSSAIAQTPSKGGGFSGGGSSGGGFGGGGGGSW